LVHAHKLIAAPLQKIEQLAQTVMHLVGPARPGAQMQKQLPAVGARFLVLPRKAEGVREVS